MKIFYWNELIKNTNATPYFSKGSGISIGSFDGLHKGHRLLLSSLIQFCNSKKLLKGVFTFPRPLPSVKYSKEYLGDISTLQQRLCLFETLGIDFVIIANFDDDFAKHTGIEFLTSLCTLCNMKFLAEGIDFRCGYKGATDTQAIKYFAEKNDLETNFVDSVYYNNGSELERVSSSFIRQMIKDGFLSTVQELLERPYELDLSGFNSKNINRSEIIQVLPPEKVYHCNKEECDLRVEITEKKITLSDVCDKLIF